MRLEQLRVDAFGPLQDEALDFAPRMTVVFGPNESAKTSLHAATYAALCGRRRARGQPRVEDREFEQRHRPWDGGPWRVSVIVCLEDGRRIEIGHDLSGGVDCRATDLVLGHDVSAEIMVDGSPDGSRFVGFDRTSFIGTACVRQASVAAVLDSAAALQDALQSAAASAGRDETAAAAIERLKAFRSEKVGLARSNSTRPLQRAIEAAGARESKLSAARQEHDDYLAELERVSALEERVAARRRDLEMAEAVVLRADADHLRRQSERATELAARYPVEPVALADLGERSDDVAEALAGWEQRPDVPDRSGETVEQIQERIAALPDPPEGDRLPAQVVLDAEREHTLAVRELAQHRARRPDDPAHVTLPAEAAELSELAVDMETPIPVVDESLRTKVMDLRATSVTSERAVRRAPLAVAGLLLTIGIVLLVAGLVIPGVGVALVGVTVGGTVLWLGRTRQDLDAAAALAVAEQALAGQESAASLASARRAGARARLEEFGLPTDPESIRAGIAAAAIAVSAAESVERWREEERTLIEQQTAASESLRAELQARGIDVGSDLPAGVEAYRAACTARDSQARAVSERPALELRLEARRSADAAHAAADAAALRVSNAAMAVGLDCATPDHAAAGLRRWQREKQRELEAATAATAEWAELSQLLGGRSLDEFAVEADAVAMRAEHAVVPFSEADLAGIDLDRARAGVATMRDEVAQLDTEAAGQRGRLEQLATSIASVPECEETLAAAEAELARVRALESILDRTIEYLEEAQERVHRTIAPVLQETLRAWLPRVTISTVEGVDVPRYTDVTVDPQSLAVTVRAQGGAWRDAGLLSEGTKEQIFLLLRVALAEHLTKPGERAPLLLDEITAQCDASRCAALLDLVRELSAERQVVLFTHDERALEWAREHLDVESGTDHLEVREALAIGGA